MCHMAYKNDDIKSHSPCKQFDYVENQKEEKKVKKIGEESISRNCESKFKRGGSKIVKGKTKLNKT